MSTLVVPILLLVIMFASGFLLGTKVHLLMLQSDLRKRTREQWAEYCESVLNL